MHNKFIIIFCALFIAHAKLVANPPTAPCEQVYEAVTNTRGWPAFHYALFNNHFEAAEWLLEHEKESLSKLTPKIKLMRYSCSMSDKRECAHVEEGFEEGYSALELALIKKQYALASYILQHVQVDINRSRLDFDGTYINSWISEHWGPHGGIYAWHYNHVQEWVKQMNINQLCVTRITSTPIFWAIIASDLTPLDLLLKKNVQLNDVYKIELGRGVDYIVEKYVSADALEIASFSGREAALKKIIAHLIKSSEDDIPEDVIALFRNYGGRFQQAGMLFQAMAANDTAAFDTLIKYGANIQSKEFKTGVTLFDKALQHSNPAFSQILVEHMRQLKK
jgi:ankyrin repeat protein